MDAVLKFSLHAPHTPAAWIAAIALGLIVAAGADLAVLEHRLRAGPYDYPGPNCATPRAAGSAGALPAGPGAGPDAWTSFLGGPLHNEVLSDPAGRGSSPAIHWQFTAHGTIITPPAVSAATAFFGSMDGCVYAVDLGSGALRWSFGSDNQIMSQPLVVAGLVFVASGNKGMAHTPTGQLVRGTGQSSLYALDAATGQVVWQVPTLGGTMPTPTYRDGVLYAVGGGKVFYAVDAQTGHVLWQLPVGSYVSMSSPTLDGNVAVFGGALPYVFVGVNVATRSVAWRLPLPGVSSGADDVSPAIANGVAYVQVPEGKLTKRVVEMAIRTSDGGVLWTRTLGVDRFNVVQRALGQGEMDAHGGEEAGISTLANGVLYVGSPGVGRLWALDPSSGAVLWSSLLPAGQAVRNAPVVADGLVYATSDTHLLILDARTGSLRASRAVGTFSENTGILIPCITAGPTIVGRTLLVGGGRDSDTLLAMPLPSPG